MVTTRRASRSGVVVVDVLVGCLYYYSWLLSETVDGKGLAAGRTWE